MKLKRILPVIIVIIAIAVLIPVYFKVVQPSVTGDDGEKVPQTGSHGEQMTAMGRHFIIDPMDEEDISVLKVTNANGGFEFFRGDDGNMYLRGAEQHLYNGELQKQLYANAATYLLAIEKLEKHEDLATYGLTAETCLATVELTKTDGSFYKLIIGDKLVTGGSYYAMLEGRDAVYVVDTMLESVLFCSARDYILPLMLPVIDQNETMNISDFTLIKDGDTFVQIEKMTPEEEAETVIYGQHKMVYPAQYTPSAENVTLLLQSLSAFTADRVLEYGVNEDILNYYGFKTGMKYELRYTYNGVTYVLYFSGRTHNNTHYVYSPLFDIIGEMSVDKLSYLEWDLIKFVDKLIFMIDINSIKSIEFENAGAKSLFELTGDGDSLKVTHNGTLMDTTSFRYFYKSLMSIAIDGYETMPENTSPYISMVITTRNGHVLDFDFYEVGSLKSFFTLNGSGEFYVHRDHLRGVIRNLAKIAAGEIITE